jgi:hypothetical protein
MTDENTLSVTDNRTGRTYEIPIKDGAIRAMALRDIKVDDDDFGLLSYDPAFMNTASCRSAITYIDGDQGILRYRGYPIQELAERVSFMEVAWLLVSGDLPDQGQLAEWTDQVNHHTFVKENIKKFIDGFHHDAHPMGILVGTVGALSTCPPTPSGSTTRPSGAASRPADHKTPPWPPAPPPPQATPAPTPTTRAVVRRQLPQPHVEDGGQVPPDPCSSALTSRSPSTPTTSRTARPTPCGPSAAPGSTRSRPPRPPWPPCTGPCTAGRTSWCCGC